MSDSDTRPVSVELPQQTWFDLLSPGTGAGKHDFILEEIQRQVGLGIPNRLAAIVLATVNSANDHEVCIRARPDPRVPWYVPSVGIWVSDAELTHISAVLFQGVTRDATS